MGTGACKLRYTRAMENTLIWLMAVAVFKQQLPNNKTRSGTNVISQCNHHYNKHTFVDEKRDYSGSVEFRRIRDVEVAEGICSIVLVGEGLLVQVVIEVLQSFFFRIQKATEGVISLRPPNCHDKCPGILSWSNHSAERRLL
ncbi:hypothetical protein NECAME_10494 [Necator americanus]|uniref:Uncharacterized protein n=1 Tax=Necator americanus TaxID=51031 RepID=W2TAI9_NECAM|nr:hypothetical protein NECAME_10494 [Necator americanus]ETN78211.1 hypothetical protein NECAME_10494 [Necator americanus]